MSAQSCADCKVRAVRGGTLRHLSTARHAAATAARRPRRRSALAWRVAEGDRPAWMYVLGHEEEAPEGWAPSLDWG